MSRSTLLVALVVLAALACQPWVRLNVSGSVPYGLYRLRSVTLPLERGTLVVLPVPASVRRWHSGWLPLLKPVAAVEGDMVCEIAQVFWISRAFYGVVYREAAGMALPQMFGEDACVVVPADMIVLASQARRSIDARYFGLTPVATITAQAIPLLTWR
jgi:conjugative transfer signal peptidase TraF